MVDESNMPLLGIVGKQVKGITVRTNFARQPIMISIEFNDRVLQIQHDPEGTQEQGELDIYPYDA